MSKSKRDQKNDELLKDAGWPSARARQTAENDGVIPILPPPAGYVVKRGRKPKKK